VAAVVYQGHDLAVVSAQNVKSGEAQITAEAVFPEGYSAESVSDYGMALVDLCANPWPARTSEQPSQYVNLEFNFGLSYCRDAGVEGIDDDLPALNPNDFITDNQIRSHPDGAIDELLWEYLIPVPTTQDLIGLRVYENSYHLSPSDWYRRNIGVQGSPSSLTVDGYQAIKAIYTSKYGQDVVGLLAIKRPDRIYLVTTEDVDSLDKIIEGWKWLTYDEARLYYPTPLDERNVVQIGDTISGKISQFSTLLLDTRFGVKQVPYSRDDYRYYLSFLPGKIKNAEFFLDGAKTGAVYGFAQYPDVECDNSFTEGGMSTSWGLYGNSVHHQPLISQEECVAAKREELPPVLFFFKNQGMGKH